MTILEVRTFFKENPDAKVLNPSGFEYSADDFFGARHWPDEYVFSNGWKAKHEPLRLWAVVNNGRFHGTYQNLKDAERAASVFFMKVVEMREVSDETT